MIWTLTWIETCQHKEDVDSFIDTLSEGTYMGFNESTGLHEIMARETFEANNIENAKDLVKDIYIELINENGELREFGCTAPTGEYFSNEEL